MKRKFFVGYTQGDLTIIEYPYKSKKVLVKCKCDFEYWVWLGNLSSHKTMRCRECSKKPASELTFNACKRTAARRELKWEIGFDDWLTLVKADCYYCGVEPSNCSYGFMYNGLDRVRNDYGYELSNVVTCCLVCNRAKSNLTQGEFYSWVRMVHERLLQV